MNGEETKKNLTNSIMKVLEEWDGALGTPSYENLGDDYKPVYRSILFSAIIMSKFKKETPYRSVVGATSLIHSSISRQLSKTHHKDVDEFISNSLDLLLSHIKEEPEKELH